MLIVKLNANKQEQWFQALNTIYSHSFIQKKSKLYIEICHNIRNNINPFPTKNLFRRISCRKIFSITLKMI